MLRDVGLYAQTILQGLQDKLLDVEWENIPGKIKESFRHTGFDRPTIQNISMSGVDQKARSILFQYEDERDAILDDPEFQTKDAIHSQFEDKQLDITDVYRRRWEDQYQALNKHVDTHDRRGITDHFRGWLTDMNAIDLYESNEGWETLLASDPNSQADLEAYTKLSDEQGEWLLSNIDYYDQTKDLYELDDVIDSWNIPNTQGTYAGGGVYKTGKFDFPLISKALDYIQGK